MRESVNVYVCMYVCMHVCMYVCMCIYVCVYIYIHTYYYYYYFTWLICYKDNNSKSFSVACCYTNATENKQKNIESTYKINV